MDFAKDSQNYYTPFFPNSVNLLSASTNSGKTSLIINFIKNKKNCFVRDFNKVLVVLCNEKVNGDIFRELSSDDLEVETCYLTEFIPEQFLNENDLLVFEDVAEITAAISESVNVLCHHLDLNSIFLITQSILKEDTFKNLLSLAHRVILFFSGVAASKVALFIKRFYFVNAEIKEYFTGVISYAEKKKSVVLFELNDVNGRFQTNYFAIANFDVFFHSFKRPTLIFPKMNDTSDFESSFSDNATRMSDVSDLPRNAFVLVPVKNVFKKSAEKAKEKRKETDDETKWNMMNHRIEDDIVTGLKYRNQPFAKNLARHILSSKKFVVSSDGKTFNIQNSQDGPKRFRGPVSMLDYLNLASRMGGPKEKIEPIYYQITKLLLDSKTPKLFFRNKNLFNLPSKKSSKKILNSP